MEMNETHVLRDPIHGYIHIREEVIWKLLDTPEFQRLRQIRQLGGDVMVYHTSEHSRFSHSLGVYELFRRVLEEVPGVRESLSELEAKAGLCAALLHDVGHGPFSHSFENITHISHEDLSCRLITDPASRINQVLCQEDTRLPEMIVSVLRHEGVYPLLEDLISSQLDCDRMDYLLRDAYFTGTSYGHFDLERILRTLRVSDGRLCVKKSGMHSVEDYIMARYQMYWQVYLHPDAASYELLVVSFFKAYEKTRKQAPIELLEPVYRVNEDLKAFFTLDDFSVLTGIRQAMDSPDPVLADLAGRILNRQLLGWTVSPSKEKIEEIRKNAIRQGIDPEYYVMLKTLESREFLPYKEEGQTSIKVLDQGGLRNLSDCSTVVKALLAMQESRTERLYYPKNLDAKN